MEAVQDMMNPQSITIGIIGGGQLGMMIAQAAKRMGFFVCVLDPTPRCSASQVADKHIVGDFFDVSKLKELCSQSHVVTFDIERADASLIDFAKKGSSIFPSPYILELIQDKLEQKKMLSRHHIPTPSFMEIQSLQDIESFAEQYGYPVVQKICRGGYDGGGIIVIKNKQDITKALRERSYLEQYIHIKKELAVTIARSKTGSMISYPVVETTFDARAHICDMVIAPARVHASIQKKVQHIGMRTMRALGEGAIGVFSIEMFLTHTGNILVNEIAPRPHNSAHYTIEACATSQFEQHVRAITGLPLGSTDLIIPAVMVNILGKPGYTGKVAIQGIEKALSIAGASFHWYGKAMTKPYRKMGHVTIIDKNSARAIQKAKRIKQQLRVISTE